LGCAVGEVLGMVIGTALGQGNGATIALAVALAFVFWPASTILSAVLPHEGMLPGEWLSLVPGYLALTHQICYR